MSQDLKVLQSYYKSFKNIAENKSDEEFQLLHIEDQVENFIRDKLNNNKIVIVTGSPGDGKTHLIKYLQPNIPSNTKIILDANEKTDEIIKSIGDCHQKKEPLVIAINEGVLLTCAQESNDEIAKYLIDCVLYQYLPPQHYDKFADEVYLVNLKNRNNLNQKKIQRILDKITETFTPCDNCPGCEVAENLSMIQKETIKEKLIELLSRSSVFAPHFTMREIWAFFSYLINNEHQCGGEKIEAMNYYNNIFDNELEGIFDWVKQFDPMNFAFPKIDYKLWLFSPDLINDENYPGGFKNVQKPQDLDEQDDRFRSFINFKRKSYFESVIKFEKSSKKTHNAHGIYEDLLENNSDSKRKLISFINNLFGIDDDNFLYLFLSHRFDVQKQEYVITNKRIPNDELEIIVPKLNDNIKNAFENFSPEYVMFDHKDNFNENNVSPSALKVNLDLLKFLLDSKLKTIKFMGFTPQHQKIINFLESSKLQDKALKDINDISKVYLTALGDGDSSTEIKIDLANKKYLHFRNTL
tara:strand:- start:15042 stop:16613 length:1572 start_codon:yes stop_codon:yes gene_type:complete